MYQTFYQISSFQLCTRYVPDILSDKFFSTLYIYVLIIFFIEFINNIINNIYIDKSYIHRKVKVINLILLIYNKNIK